MTVDSSTFCLVSSVTLLLGVDEWVWSIAVAGCEVDDVVREDNGEEEGEEDASRSLVLCSSCFCCCTVTDPTNEGVIPYGGEEIENELRVTCSLTEVNSL